MEPTPLTQTQLIAFCGKAGSGKSTAADHLVAKGWKRVKFAGPLKNMLRTLYADAGLTEAQIEDRIEGVSKETPDPLLMGCTPRHAMITLGSDWGRDQIGHSLWTGLWFQRVSNLMKAGYNVVVDDLRFPNEAMLVREMEGQIITIGRRDHVVIDSPSENYSPSADYVVDNNGSVEDLYLELDTILK